jgi:hypothetical protein
VTPSGAAVTTKLTVTAGTLAHAGRPDLENLFPTTVLAGGVLLLVGKRRPWHAGILVAIAMIVLSTITACSGGGSAGSGGGGKTPITSTVTVAATSGTLQQSATFSLTVN